MKISHYAFNFCSVTGLLFAFVLAAMTGCGDGDNDFDALLAQYSGIWDVRYNFSEDSCAIVEPGVIGFVDRHVIDQVGSSISLESSSGFGLSFSGQVREDNSFVVEQILSGDIFGDGIACDVFQAISYEPTGPDTASSLFVRRLSCEDGYICESRGVGESRRR